jgi:hypothetical protein
MSDCCMVFFTIGASSLEKAREHLCRTSLVVEAFPDVLLVSYEDSPQYRVYFSDAPHVQIEAAEIGAARPEEATMRTFGARFEIVIPDLDEALDEINTLLELQSALQEISGGYLFLPWNDSLHKPWPEQNIG